MMSPKISVILPVYNTGVILKDTIDSILSQTFSDFELLLIDDGSIDISSKICDEYSNLDKRIRVVHQKNSGICHARNVGIKMARGVYVTFCDHDDIYMPTKLEVSYNLALKYHSDIVNVGNVSMFDDGENQTKAIELVCLNRYELEMNIFKICPRLTTIWDNLYKVDSFGDQFKFDPKYTRGQEDINFNFNLLQHTNSFVASKKILYCHIIRKNLSTSSKIDPKVVEGMIDVITNYSNCVESFNIDVSKRLGEYTTVLGIFMRSLCIYMVKAGFSYKQYKSNVLKIKNAFLKGCHTFSIYTLIFKKDLLFLKILQINIYISYLVSILFLRIQRLHGKRL